MESDLDYNKKERSLFIVKFYDFLFEYENMSK